MANTISRLGIFNVAYSSSQSPTDSRNIISHGDRLYPSEY
jgi:hypothetical protein